MSGKEEVFEQDLKEQVRPGAVFMVQLLFQDEPALPDKETVENVMKKHFGDIDCFWHDEKGAGIAVKRVLAQFKDASVPPQLMITSPTGFDGGKMDAFERSQMWSCMEDRDRILEECRYQVLATDMLAAALTAKERAELDMDFMEALAELFPSCEAFYFISSGKLFPAEQIRTHRIAKEDRFIYFAVNVRFFNIQNTEDMLVDTLGMSVLFLPDIQYHFHGMDPNCVVNHAYNIASYILESDNPIENGDFIDGLEKGRTSPGVQWRCRYENALIQPAREVIDIHMGNYASGGRGEE